MTDRVDFYFRQHVTEAELDLAFALLEKADWDLSVSVVTGTWLLFRQTRLAYSEASAVGATAMRASDGGARRAKRRGPASPLDRRSSPLT